MTFQIHCDHCGNSNHPTALYCMFCGTEIPPKTLPAEVFKKAKIRKGYYCPHCHTLNPPQAHFCISCGKFFFELPGERHLFCPHCGEKNRSGARFCFQCHFHLEEWFAMQGEVAKELGCRGSLILTETMTNTHYHFWLQNQLTLGRKPENDIVIPSGLVSGRHCRMDWRKDAFIDLDSTNGTYINRSPERIEKVPLSRIFEFNIAGSFTFSVVKTPHIFGFRLTSIWDEEEVKKYGHFQKIQELRQHYHILVGGDEEIYVRKMDGKIIQENIETEECVRIRIKDRCYYFIDFQKSSREILLFAKINLLPINWKYDVSGGAP